MNTKNPIPIRTAAIFTLFAFIFTQAVPSYALRQVTAQSPETLEEVTAELTGRQPSADINADDAALVKNLYEQLKGISYSSPIEADKVIKEYIGENFYEKLYLPEYYAQQEEIKMPAIDLMLSLLVVIGYKPACLLDSIAIEVLQSFVEKFPDRFGLKLIRIQGEDMHVSLSTLGLIFYNKKIIEGSETIQDFVKEEFSLSENKSADDIVELMMNDHHHRIGVLLGFPVSDVKMYMSGQGQSATDNYGSKYVKWVHFGVNEDEARQARERFLRGESALEQIIKSASTTAAPAPRTAPAGGANEMSRVQKEETGKAAKAMGAEAILSGITAALDSKDWTNALSLYLALFSEKDLELYAYRIEAMSKRMAEAVKDNFDYKISILDSIERKLERSEKSAAILLYNAICPLAGIVSLGSINPYGIHKIAFNYTAAPLYICIGGTKLSFKKDAKTGSVVLRNETENKELEIEDGIIYSIGRDFVPDGIVNDFNVKDRSVSKRHLEIMVDNSTVFIKDLESKHGTKLIGLPSYTSQEEMEKTINDVKQISYILGDIRNVLAKENLGKNDLDLAKQIQKDVEQKLHDFVGEPDIILAYMRDLNVLSDLIDEREEKFLPLSKDWSISDVQMAPAETDPIVARTGTDAGYRAKNECWRVWWSSKESIPSQGWKIHITGTRQTMGHILDVVLPILHREDIEHKVVNGFSGMALLEETNTQEGKYIVVYPGFTPEDYRKIENQEKELGHFWAEYAVQKEKARAVAYEIDKALLEAGLTRESTNAPAVKQDKVRGKSGLVFSRYGGFTTLTLETPGGEKESDRRDNGHKPEWLNDSFGVFGSRSSATGVADARGAGKIGAPANAAAEVTDQEIEALWDEIQEEYILYHGTSSLNINSILQHGLDPEYKPFDSTDVDFYEEMHLRVLGAESPLSGRHRSGIFYLTTNRQNALDYANNGPEIIKIMLAQIPKIISKAHEAGKLSTDEVQKLEGIQHKYNQWISAHQPVILRIKGSALQDSNIAAFQSKENFIKAARKARDNYREGGDVAGKDEFKSIILLRIEAQVSKVSLDKILIDDLVAPAPLVAPAAGAQAVAKGIGAEERLQEKIERIEDAILQRKAKDLDVSHLADVKWSGALISDDKALDEIINTIFTRPISESMQRVGRKMFYFPRQARNRSLTRAQEKAVVHMKEILGSDGVRGKKDKEAKAVYLFAAMFKALLMQDEADIKLPYVPHSIAHVINVVEAVQDLIQKVAPVRNGLEARYGNNGRMAALLTAWLHDIGYSILDEAERKVGKEFKGFNKELPLGEEALKTRKGYHARLSARMFEAEIVTIKDKNGGDIKVSLASLVSDIGINIAAEITEAILLHGADKPEVLSEGLPGTGKNAYTKASDTDKPLLFCVREADNTDIMAELRFHSYQGTLWFLKLLEELAGDSRDINDLTDQELSERNDAIKAKFKNLVDLGNLDDSVPYRHRVAQLIIEKKINEAAAKREAINEFRTILENLDRFDQTNFEHFAGCIAILGYERIYDKDKGYMLKVYLSKSRLESFSDPEVAQTQVKRIEEAFGSLSVDGKPIKISKKIVDDTKFYEKGFLSRIPAKKMPASERKTLKSLAKAAVELSSGKGYFSFFTEGMWQRLLTKEGVSVVSNGELKKGEILIEQDQVVSINGTNEPAMFFILEGVFEIYDKYTGFKRGELSAGDVLGEIGPILGRRIASARVQDKNKPAKAIKMPVRIYNELIRDCPVFADELAEMAAERMARNKVLEGRDMEERAKIDRILRWISFVRDHLDYTFTKAKEGDKDISAQEVDEVISALESQDRLGSIIFNEKMEEGDFFVVFEVPGVATSGKFGIKQLNDKLSYELNSQLIDIRREVLKRLMAKNGLVYSTYKEDVFLVKAASVRRVAQRQGKTAAQFMDGIRRALVSEITDTLLADSKIFKRTLIKNGVKINDLSGTIFEVRVGISRIEGSTAKGKIMADINAHQAAVMEMFFKDGFFSKGRYKRFISHIRDIRNGLAAKADEVKNRMFEFVENGRAFLTQETAGILRKRAAWQELAEKDKAFFGGSKEFYQASVEYMDCLNVQDYIRKWQPDFDEAVLYSESAKDVVKRLKGLRKAASRQENQGQAYIVTGTDAQLLESARRILMQNPKAPGISSEYDFYLRGPPMEKAVHVALDVRNMGLMNIKEFQSQIQDIESALLDREKEDWASVRDIWMSAADNVTKDFFRVQDIIKDTLRENGLSEADYVLSIGGDESNLVINGNKFSPGLLLAIKNNITQGTDGRMAVRACATRSAEKYRKKFASRGKEHAMRLAHAMAMLDSEEGILRLKYFESKGNDTVFVQNRRGAWRQYPVAPVAGVEAKMAGETKPTIVIFTDNVEMLKKDLEQAKSYEEYNNVEIVPVDISGIDGLASFTEWKNDPEVLKILNTASAVGLRIYEKQDLANLFTMGLNGAKIEYLTNEVDFNDRILQLIHSV